MRSTRFEYTHADGRVFRTWAQSVWTAAHYFADLLELDAAAVRVRCIRMPATGPGVVRTVPVHVAVTAAAPAAGRR